MAYVVDHNGSELVMAVRSDLARDLRSALRLGQHPTLEFDRHHVLQGFPAYPEAGQALAEYAILFGVIVAVAIVLLLTFGGQVSGLLSMIGGSV